MDEGTEEWREGGRERQAGRQAGRQADIQTDRHGFFINCSKKQPQLVWYSYGTIQFSFNFVVLLLFGN